MFEMVTDSYVSHLIAMFIIMVFAISFSIGCSSAYGTKPITGKFDLGFIEDREETPVCGKNTPVSPSTPRPSPEGNDPHDELKQLKRQVEIAKLKKQLAGLQNPTEQGASEPKVNVLLDACQAALVSLGVPKRKAKAEADVVLQSNPSIKTVQDFITEYGKR